MFFRTFLVLALLQAAVVAAPDPAEPPRPRVISTPTPFPQRKPKAVVKRPVIRSREQIIADYMPEVKAALAGRWASAVTPRMSEFTSGNLGVSFKLDGDGKVIDFAVKANTSNEPFAKFCDAFVRETKFEPPPARALVDGQLEIPFTFTIY